VQPGSLAQNDGTNSLTYQNPEKMFERSHLYIKSVWCFASISHRTRSLLRAILKAGFPIFVAIKQALVSVFAYIWQDGQNPNLCLMATLTSLKFYTCFSTTCQNTNLLRMTSLLI